MKHKIMILVLVLFCSKVNSQSNETYSLENTWYFGVEIGVNDIISFQDISNTKSAQIGVLAEYYLSNNWSVTGRIKYFKTGLSFKDNRYKFNGKVIAVPINLKWEFNFIKNLRANLSLGLAFNQELEKKYSYPEGKNTDFSSFYTNSNIGIGFNYVVSKRIGIYTNVEIYYFGNDKEGVEGKYFIFPHSTNNVHYNLGVKYNFK